MFSNFVNSWIPQICGIGSALTKRRGFMLANLFYRAHENHPGNLDISFPHLCICLTWLISQNKAWIKAHHLHFWKEMTFNYSCTVISSKQKSKAFFFIVFDKSVRIQYYPNSVPGKLLNKMTNIRQLISIARRRKLWIWSNRSFLPFYSPFLTFIKGTRLQINSIKFHFTPW